jgi:hypothetical protein
MSTSSIPTSNKDTTAPTQKAVAPKEPATAASASDPKSPDHVCTPACTHEDERRRAMIAEAAYFIAERRGFSTGSELDDWLVAEVQIDFLLKAVPPTHIQDSHG